MKKTCTSLVARKPLKIIILSVTRECHKEQNITEIKKYFK